MNPFLARMQTGRAGLFAVSALLIAAFTACQKHHAVITPQEDDQAIPILLSNVSRIQTRASGSSFDPDDKIGLFVVEKPNELTDTRHVDNKCYQWDGSQWGSNTISYYPSKESQYNFYAYYPYTAVAIEEGETQMKCTVYANQSIAQNYMLSDFLVAERRNVEPSEEAVSLVFKHKMVEINIVLLPGDAYESPAALLADNPTVEMMQVATEVMYDMKEASFSNAREKSNVTFAGSFVADNTKVYGKHAIIVPQTIAGDHILLWVTVGGKRYGFAFGADYQMRSATQETYTLTMRKRELPDPGVPEIISASIAPWENTSQVEGELKEENPEESVDGVSFTLPDFSSSSVYAVMNGDRKVAEVCREYLKGVGIDHQAIVIYPVADGKADLSNGFVSMILDGHAGQTLPANTHGGTVSWNAVNNTLAYTAGNAAATTSIYMNAEGRVLSSAVGAVALSLQPELITDAKNSQTYSIVKIGTQYWMNEDLKTKVLMDGTELVNGNTGTTWKNEQAKSPITAMMYVSNDSGSGLFYNKPAMESAHIAPAGWVVPAYDDWIKLQTYLGYADKDDMPLLKDTEWGGGTNLTGFTAKLIGFCTPTKGFSNTCFGFWLSNGNSVVIDATGGMVDTISGKYGFAIRCLRQ